MSGMPARCVELFAPLGAEPERRHSLLARGPASLRLAPGAWTALNIRLRWVVMAGLPIQISWQLQGGPLYEEIVRGLLDGSGEARRWTRPFVVARVSRS